MKHLRLPAFLALAAFALAACAPQVSTNVGQTSCTVERLQLNPSQSAIAGSLGMPPSHLSQAEIAATAACLAPALDRAMAAASEAAVRRTSGWTAMSSAYRGSEHGMFLQVYADPIAAPSYSRYENGGAIPVGGTILKRSFRVSADGKASAFALFVMERMPPGFSPATNDWRFVRVAPDGATFGATNGPNDAGVRYCVACHETGRRQDFLLFVPPNERL